MCTPLPGGSTAAGRDAGEEQVLEEPPVDCDPRAYARCNGDTDDSAYSREPAWACNLVGGAFAQAGHAHWAIVYYEKGCSQAVSREDFKTCAGAPRTALYAAREQRISPKEIAATRALALERCKTRGEEIPGICTLAGQYLQEIAPKDLNAARFAFTRDCEISGSSFACNQARYLGAEIDYEEQKRVKEEHDALKKQESDAAVENQRVEQQLREEARLAKQNEPSVGDMIVERLQQGYAQGSQTPTGAQAASSPTPQEGRPAAHFGQRPQLPGCQCVGWCGSEESRCKGGCGENASCQSECSDQFFQCSSSCPKNVAPC